MIEPEAPVTFRVEETPSPALTLTGDQHIRLEPHTAVLRHRHVRQQYTVILEYGLPEFDDLQLNSVRDRPPIDPVSDGDTVTNVRRSTRGYPVIAPVSMEVRYDLCLSSLCRPLQRRICKPRPGSAYHLSRCSPVPSYTYP